MAHTLLLAAHPGYLTWEQYQDKLRENTQAYSSERRKSPPREGPAPRQGLLSCGRYSGSNRYRLNQLVLQLTLFMTQIYNRVFSRGLAELHPGFPDTKLNRAWNKFDAQLQTLLEDARLVA